MICRTELKRLQSHHDYPSISVLAPTHRAAPANKRDRINRSAVRDESHRQFFRQVDDALAAIQKEDPLPVVVVGVDRFLAFFQEITKQPDSIVGFVAGSHDQPSPSALGKLVWPVLKAGITLKRTRALVRLKEAVSANRHASGIDQVWRAAFDKRCQTNCGGAPLLSRLPVGSEFLWISVHHGFCSGLSPAKLAANSPLNIGV